MKKIILVIVTLVIGFALGFSYVKFFGNNNNSNESESKIEENQENVIENQKQETVIKENNKYDLSNWQSSQDYTEVDETLSYKYYEGNGQLYLFDNYSYVLNYGTECGNMSYGYYKIDGTKLYLMEKANGGCDVCYYTDNLVNRELTINGNNISFTENNVKYEFSYSKTEKGVYLYDIFSGTDCTFRKTR